MKKAEREAKQQANFSKRLVNDLRRGFSNPEQRHLIYTVIPSDVDWDILEKCQYPMSVVSPDDGRMYPTICFKRSESEPEYTWPEMFNICPPPVWRG